MYVYIYCILLCVCVGVSVKYLAGLMIAFLIALIRVTDIRIRICAFLHAFKGKRNLNSRFVFA